MANKIKDTDNAPEEGVPVEPKQPKEVKLVTLVSDSGVELQVSPTIVNSYINNGWEKK